MVAAMDPRDSLPAELPVDALDDPIAIVGTAVRAKLTRLKVLSSISSREVRSVA